MDDNLVQFDKIGSGAFFWSLPSMGLQNRRNLLENIDKHTSEVDEKQENLTEQLKEEKLSREEGEEESREDMHEELQKLRKESANLK